MATQPSGSADNEARRLETLLAAVRDTSCYLYSISRQLEREVGEALDRGPQPTDTRAALEALEAENAQLRQALEGRGVIERAKGLLMAVHHCDEDAAFQMLVALSRQERRKLRAVSSEVVDRHAGGRRRPAAADQASQPQSIAGGRPVAEASTDVPSDRAALG